MTHRLLPTLLAAALPAGREVWIPGAGHMGPLTHGTLVNEAIRGHLAAAGVRFLRRV